MMNILRSKTVTLLISKGFKKRKIDKIIRYISISKTPCNLFIKYQGKKYILDIVGENPQTASVELMRPKKFKEWYGDFDIPELDWI